jgi:hypothetical protein
MGAEGKEVYVYRGDVANNALRLAGNELGLFIGKAEVTHRSRYDDLTDLELVKMLQQEATLLLEYYAKQAAAVMTTVTPSKASG